MVARLGAAAGEDDLIGLRSEQLGHLGAGTVDGVVGGLAVNVGAGRVAEVVAEKRQHGVDDGGVERGGGVVVEVDRSHGCPCLAVYVTSYNGGKSQPNRGWLL